MHFKYKYSKNLRNFLTMKNNTKKNCKKLP